MRRATALALGVLLLGIIGCDDNQKAGPVPDDQVVTDVKVDPAKARAGIEEQKEKIRNSDLPPADKEKALKLLGG